jgi:CRISPR-associated endoribonuclease Cas6
MSGGTGQTAATARHPGSFIRCPTKLWHFGAARLGLLTAVGGFTKLNLPRRGSEAPMQSDDFASLELARYELRLRAAQQAALPAFLGSTLRGAFGHALKQAVCIMAHRDCERCMVAEQCLYPYLFETPVPLDAMRLLRNQTQAPRPFILAPPLLKGAPRAQAAAGAPAFAPAVSPARAETNQPRLHQLTDGRTVRLVQSPREASPESRTVLRAGESLRFGLLLMGRATEYLPYVVFAVSEMARRGLGAARAPFVLNEVAVLDEQGAARTIYSGKAGRLQAPAGATHNLAGLVRARLAQLSVEAGASEAIKVRFITPTRIRVDSDLQAETDFVLLVRNLLRRISMLAAVHGSAPLELDYHGLLERAARIEMRAARLRWHDWERYSNRQQTKMKLGGFTGEVEYVGEGLPEFLPLLVAGELLHVGTGTTFGLGKYQMLMR